MRTVYKYPIRIVDVQIIKIHKCKTRHPELLKVGLDPSGNPCIWARVDPDELQTYPLPIYITGTGHSVPEYYEYFDSFNQGELVWHVFTDL